MTPRFREFGSPRARRVVLLGVAIVIAVAGIWAIVSRRSHGAQDAGGTRATNAAGMEGMAGMSISSNGSVKLTAGQIRQFGITFGTVEVRPLTAETRTNGVVAFDETRVAQV